MTTSKTRDQECRTKILGRLKEMGLDGLWSAALGGDEVAMLKLKRLASTKPAVRQALASLAPRRNTKQHKKPLQRGNWASLTTYAVGWVSFVQGGLPSLPKRK